MTRYEYRVVPAPTRGRKARGVKRPEMKFSLALQDLMNQMGADGWEYQRAETLPSIERAGLTSTTTEWRNVLVFRRPHTEAVEDALAGLLPPPLDAMLDASADTSDNGVEQHEDISVDEPEAEQADSPETADDTSTDQPEGSYMDKAVSSSDTKP